MPNEPKSSEKPVLFHNPRCSKSREALALLKERGVAFDVVDYLKNPPSTKDVRALVAKLDGPPFTLLRTKEPAFAELDLGPDASAEQVADAIAADPVLLERPVLVVGAKAAIGRPIEKIAALLG